MARALAARSKVVAAARAAAARNRTHVELARARRPATTAVSLDTSQASALSLRSATPAAALPTPWSTARIRTRRARSAARLVILKVSITSVSLALDLVQPTDFSCEDALFSAHTRRPNAAWRPVPPPRPPPPRAASVLPRSAIGKRCNNCGVIGHLAGVMFPRSATPAAAPPTPWPTAQTRTRPARTVARLATSEGQMPRSASPFSGARRTEEKE